MINSFLKLKWVFICPSLILQIAQSSANVTKKEFSPECEQLPDVIRKIAQSNINQAKMMLIEQLKKDSTDYKALYNLGIFHLAYIKDTIVARDYFIRGTYVNPECKDCWYNWAVYLAKNNQNDSAILLFSKAIAIDSNYYAAYCGRASTISKIGKIEQGLEDIKRAILIHPEQSEAFFIKGISMEKKEMVDSAISSYEMAIKLDPQNVKSLYNLAHLQLRKGNNKIANELFSKLTEFEPQNGNYRIMKAISLSLSSDWQRADSEYKIAEKLSPLEPKLWDNWGLMELKEGDTTLSLKYFFRKLYLQPNDRESYGRIWPIIKSKSSWKMLVDTLSSFSERNLKSAMLLEFMSYAMFEGAYPCKDIENVLEKSISIDPNNSYLYYNLACFAAKCSDKSKVIMNLRRAIELDSKWIEKAKFDNDFNNYRDDIEFKLLVKQ